LNTVSITLSVKVLPPDKLLAKAFGLSDLSGSDLRRALRRYMPKCEADIEPIKRLAAARLAVRARERFMWSGSISVAAFHVAVGNAARSLTAFRSAADDAGWKLVSLFPSGAGKGGVCAGRTGMMIWRTPRGAHYSETRGWC